MPVQKLKVFLQNSNRDRIHVLVFTYNHEKYVRECLISILNQKNVEVFITVFDDFSTDGTTDIVESLVASNRNRIQLLRARKNHGDPIANFKDSGKAWRSKCKYWVAIEGDDFFGSPFRLFIQLATLKTQRNLIGVSSNCILWNVTEDRKSIIRPDRPSWNYYDTVFLHNNLRFYVHMSSILWRKSRGGKLLPKRFLRTKENFGEVFLTTSMLRSHLRKRMFHTEIHGSTYRYTGEGIWSSLTKKEQERRNQELLKRLKTLRTFLVNLEDRYHWKLLRLLIHWRCINKFY